MQTSIYKGYVHHARRRPKRHDLHYRVFSLLIDLDELQSIKENCRLIRINQTGLFSFWEKDHGNGDESGLKKWALKHLAQAGFDTENVSVRVLCYPRILGYAFNPLTVYYCYDDRDALIAMLHEVNNTFGEKHTYVLAGSTENHRGSYQQSAPKNLAVSPFTKMDATYQFKMNVPNENIHVHIGLHDDEGMVMSASFIGTQYPLTDRALLQTFFQYPFMTLKVTVGIHFEALKLWLKGVPLIARTPAPAPVTASHQRNINPPLSAD